MLWTEKSGSTDPGLTERQVWTGWRRPLNTQCSRPSGPAAEAGEVALDPYFYLRDGQAAATAHGAGPWDPSMLHGGAPTGLIVAMLEDLPTKAPMALTRLTVDLKRPVPVGPLDIETEITREGRNIQTAEIRLLAGEKEVVRASALRIRRAEMDLPPAVTLPDLSRQRSSQAASALQPVGFNSTVVTKECAEPPPGARRAVWFRIDRPFFDARETTPLMRAAATGDYCNALGCPLDFEAWTFINADLTLHFARQPIGEWMMLAANGWIGPDGRGLAFGELSDERGCFGRAIQSLVIAPR